MKSLLDNAQTMRVLACIARGDQYAAIQDMVLREYGITIHKTTISSIKKNHAGTLAEMGRQIEADEISDAKSLLRKHHKLINRRLDKATRDMEELDALDEQYRNAEINDEDYRRKRKGLISLSISSLVATSATLHTQAKEPDEGKTKLPSGEQAPGISPAVGETLLKALQNGDAIELQRIKYTPHVDSVRPTA